MAVVVVQPYSTDWPRQFDAVRNELRLAFGPMDVAIEHIGSTAVPGLAAKPVIDVLLGAASLADVEAKIAPLGALGYEYVPKYETELPMRRYFVKGPPTARRVHVHAVVHGSAIWRNHVSFRDALRENGALRNEYQDLKLHLAAQFAADKAAYTDAKGPFIQATLSALSALAEGVIITEA